MAEISDIFAKVRGYQQGAQRGGPPAMDQYGGRLQSVRDAYWKRIEEENRKRQEDQARRWFEGASHMPQAGGGWLKAGGWGANVDRWRDVAVKALEYAGYGHRVAELLPSLLRRMHQESSGNPRAINNWDVNARRGTPSQGLMQTIPSTFNSYARELAGRGIYDPFANIVASIRYSAARYGSPEVGWNRRGGY